MHILRLGVRNFETKLPPYPSIAVMGSHLASLLCVLGTADFHRSCKKGKGKALVFQKPNVPRAAHIQLFTRISRNILLKC